MRKKVFFTRTFWVILISFLFFASFKALQFRQKQKLFYYLAEQVQEKAKELNLEYGLFIKDLSFPRAQLVHEASKRIPAASLMKLPILAAVFKAAKEGKISLNDIITIERKDISGGSGKLKAQKLPQKLPLLKLSELMITVSDNTATNKVVDLLGYDYINATFRDLGLANTSLKRKMMDFSKRRQGVENYTSALDIGYLLEQIYDKKLVNEKYCQLALSFLKNQKVNDRLPRYLPKELTVAHKTGLERGVVHDAGIVFTPKGNYIICVLVKGAKDYKKAKKFIAESSLLTYNLYK